MQTTINQVPTPPKKPIRYIALAFMRATSNGWFGQPTPPLASRSEDEMAKTKGNQPSLDLLPTLTPSSRIMLHHLLEQHECHLEATSSHPRRHECQPQVKSVVSDS